MKRRAPAKRSNVRRSKPSKAKASKAKPSKAKASRKVKKGPLGQEGKDDVTGFLFQTPGIDIYSTPSLGLY
jgi:hypothetical protein